MEGTIEKISTKPNMIVVDDVVSGLLEVFGVKFNCLDNQYNIDLYKDDEVSIGVYEFECSDGTTKLMAYEVTVGNVTVRLRNPK